MSVSCAKCRESFEILQEDLDFYASIQVPPPTLCPKDRLIRRLAFRNSHTLYKRRCDLCQQNILSVHATDSRFTVYCPTCWWSDRWNPLAYGRSFDFNRPFFDQFHELMKAVPRPALITEGSENCDYCHNTPFSKNCYLGFGCLKSEDCYYVDIVKDCRSITDCRDVFNGELCYECVNCRRCYQGVYLQNCEECSSCSFCFECKGCRNCFGCVGLRNQEYCLYNERVSKEQYEAFVSQLGSHAFFEKQKAKFEAFKKTQPQMASFQVGAENSTGNHIYFSKNARACFQVENVEDCAHCFHAADLKNSQDVFGAMMGGERQYENTAGGGGVNVQFASLSWHNTDARYLEYCNSCRDVFGGIGLTHKRFCILNKQLSESAYTTLMPKILETMRRSGELGEFFPVRISPHAYNETFAADFFPLSKEDALNAGYRWRDEASVERMEATMNEIPDNIQDVPDTLPRETFSSTKTGRPYRIIPQELALHRQMNVPLPRLHPDERYRARMERQNPFELWKRPCSTCGKEVETSYAPNRSENIFCESCYQKIIY